MKTTIYLGVLAIFLVSCVGYYDHDEPRYDVREKILGSYDVEEYSFTYHEKVYYTMHVTRGYHSNEVFLVDFYGTDISVLAIVSNNYIDIPFQIVDGLEIEGSGSYYRGELDLHYTVFDRYAGHATDHCETIAYKL